MTLEPPFGDGGLGAGAASYDNYDNEGVEFPGENGDAKFGLDFDNVQVKQEPSDVGYPAQMPPAGAPLPPPPPPQDREEGDQ